MGFAHGEIRLSDQMVKLILKLLFLGLLHQRIGSCFVKMSSLYGLILPLELWRYFTVRTEVQNVKVWSVHRCQLHGDSDAGPKLAERQMMQKKASLGVGGPGRLSASSAAAECPGAWACHLLPLDSASSHLKQEGQWRCPFFQLSDIHYWPHTTES